MVTGKEESLLLILQPLERKIYLRLSKRLQSRYKRLLVLRISSRIQLYQIKSIPIGFPETGLPGRMILELYLLALQHIFGEMNPVTSPISSSPASHPNPPVIFTVLPP